MSTDVRSSMYFLHTKLRYMRFFLCWKNYFLILVILSQKGPACADPEGGGDRGSRPPWYITKLQGSLAILVQIPWKFTQLPSQHSMFGHYRPASETPFKWCSVGGPMMAHF